MSKFTKIKPKSPTYKVHTQVWHDEVQLIVNGDVSYIPLGALTNIIDALSLIEKQEHYKAVLS